jgi:hypothetical protein
VLALLHWLYANVLGNLVASAICFTAGAAWAHRAWIRPHHTAVAGWIEGIHTRLDAAGIPDVHDAEAGGV